MTVYCVFVNDNGGYFLTQIFDKAVDAEDYRLAQGRYANLYAVEAWEVD